MGELHLKVKQGQLNLMVWKIPGISKPAADYSCLMAGFGALHSHPIPFRMDKLVRLSFSTVDVLPAQYGCALQHFVLPGRRTSLSHLRLFAEEAAGTGEAVIEFITKEAGLCRS
ncbi:hypothetical protein NDU88_004999 [Pleurodeles waltl]|uniref:Uncharacterized protein n=1 Tax=Pleurodeles waltl TaxID=8319 RepID=A0AAV7UHN6_PLEWA|nr:hypothetical protein NDU88_004999 [Pleurodeles waltl]